MPGTKNVKTKKELKTKVGEPASRFLLETGMFGPEIPEDGTIPVVGPCAHTNRRFYAQVTIKGGLISAVK